MSTTSTHIRGIKDSKGDIHYIDYTYLVNAPDVYTKTQVDNLLDNLSISGGNSSSVDLTSYYTKTQVNDNFASKNHTHTGYAESVHTHPEYASSSHNHDTRYYTQSDIDNKLANLSTGGTVDLSGYVESSRVDSTSIFSTTTASNIPTKGAVATYCTNNYASSSHEHDGYLSTGGGTLSGPVSSSLVSATILRFGQNNTTSKPGVNGAVELKAGTTTPYTPAMVVYNASGAELRKYTFPQSGGVLALHDEIPTDYASSSHTHSDYVTKSGDSTVSGTLSVSAIKSSLVYVGSSVIIGTLNNTPTNGSIGLYSSGGLPELTAYSSGGIAKYSYSFPSKTGTVALTSDLNGYCTQNNVSSSINSALTNYYTKTEVDRLIGGGSGGDTDPDDPEACLIAGTQITMADGSFKNVEDVKEGDLIKSLNPITGEETEAVVLSNKVGEVSPRCNYLLFSNGVRVGVTWDHDVYNATKGTWTDTNGELDFKDEFITEDNSRVTFIRKFENVGTPGGLRTNFYDLITSNNCYYANGILFAHNPTRQSDWLLSVERPQDLKELILSYKDDSHRETDLVANDEYIAEYLKYINKVREAEVKLGEIKANLARTDCISLALIDGEDLSSEERDILADRKQWRKEYREYQTQYDESIKLTAAIDIKYSIASEDVHAPCIQLRKRFFEESCIEANKHLDNFKEYYKNR